MLFFLLVYLFSLITFPHVPTTLIYSERWSNLFEVFYGKLIFMTIIIGFTTILLNPKTPILPGLF